MESMIIDSSYGNNNVHEENVKKIPTSWIKLGEVFRNKFEQPIFVCSSCLKNADNIYTAYTTSSLSVFWWHIKQQHISSEHETIEKIVAEIESCETKSAEPQILSGEINSRKAEQADLNEGNTKKNQLKLLEEFHENLVKNSVIKETKNILQNCDIKIRQQQNHDISLQSNGIETNTKEDQNNRNVNNNKYYYVRNDIYTISDDDDDDGENESKSRFETNYKPAEKNFLKHNDMIEISDDENGEDNIDTRPNTPAITTDDADKMENPKRQKLNDMEETILPQKNLINCIPTPDISPCESLAAQQYSTSSYPELHKNSLEYNEDSQLGQILASSTCESPATQQYSINSDPQSHKNSLEYNEDSQLGQILASSTCESPATQQYNISSDRQLHNNSLEYNADSQLDQILNSICCESPATQQYNIGLNPQLHRNSLECNEGSQLRQVLNSTPRESPATQQYNIGLNPQLHRNSLECNEGSQLRQILNSTPRESPATQQYNIGLNPQLHKNSLNGNAGDLLNLSNENSYKLFQCKICGIRDNNENNMQTHMQLHHRSVSQEFCNNQNQQQQYQQVQKTLQDGLFCCKICNRKTKTLTSMRRHHQLYHSPNAHLLIRQCEICQKRIPTEKYSQHIQLHFSAGFNCRYCGAVYKQKLWLDRHMSKNHADRSSAPVSEHIQQHPMNFNMPFTPYPASSLSVGQAPETQQQVRYQECIGVERSGWGGTC